MKIFRVTLPITSIISVLLLCLFTSNAMASYKQWPMVSKGEVRYLKMIKVYDISLYSPTKITAANVLNANVSKCLKLDYAVDLTVDKFRLATTKILKRQHGPDYLKTIQKPLEQLQSAYKPVKKGDSYNLCYNGSNQFLRLEWNDQKLAEIKSAELAKAYLGIWLSKNKPISGPLYNRFFKN